MKAWIVDGANLPVRLADIDEPVAGPGQAVVAVKAAALNHRDVWIQHGKYFIHKYPVIPGADGCGVVTAVGEGVDSRWIGREVVINPGVGWGDNQLAARDDFKTLGTPDDGTFAEKMLIPATQLFDKPAHLDAIHAAALPLAGLTGYRAVFSRGGLKAGERVLVTGAGGGVALFMLQYAVAAGARVFVSSGAPEKIARAREMGAEGGVNYRDSDWEKQLQAMSGGIDLVVDSACGPDFPKLLDVAAPGGRIVYFGITAGAAPAFDMRNFYRKQLSLLGTKMGSLADFAAMIEFVSAKRIVPVVDRVLPFSQVNEAYEALHAGGQFGKIVISVAG
ncbi:MAG: quinone oxidoreductase family protein [Janthinobacterium lividum]